MKERKSGILLHITSLPGKYGIGTLGEEAYKFVDFLKETKQTYWQILPLGHTGFGDSPYSSYSAFAGNPLLIDLDGLPVSTKGTEAFKTDKVDFNKVKKHKLPILKKCAEEFLKSGSDNDAFIAFKKENKFWLDDYCFFMCLKNKYDQRPYWMFDKALKFRDEKVLQATKKELKKEIEIYEVIQFFFFEQWYKLKSYANGQGIKILGDIPLYVAGDSTDVWVNPEIFMLNDDLSPVKVAGVPPDYFAATGQLWGNPVYDWERNKITGYKWWKERIQMNLKLFDMTRIDHFRGFSEFWAVPFGDETAENGVWLDGPEDDFLDEIFKQKEKFIAEDLGLLTEGVTRLLNRYQMPGMKILQFAFDADANNPFLPHNYDENCVVYTGTHDNDTSMGIYEVYNEKELEFLNNYFYYEKEKFAHYLIKFAWASVAFLAIAPLQDLLLSGKEHRMNTPGTIGGNWEWKFDFDDIKSEHIDFLKTITTTYGRD
jgi:4-alpha-glucanotransferase